MCPTESGASIEFGAHQEDGDKLVWHAFDDMVAGAIYVNKVPATKVTDLARVVDYTASHKVFGIRPGKKSHEKMISEEDSLYPYKFNVYFKYFL